MLFQFLEQHDMQTRFGPNIYSADPRGQITHSCYCTKWRNFELPMPEELVLGKCVAWHALSSLEGRGWISWYFNGCISLFACRCVSVCASMCLCVIGWCMVILLVGLWRYSCFEYYRLAGMSPLCSAAAFLAETNFLVAKLSTYTTKVTAIRNFGFETPLP